MGLNPVRSGGKIAVRYTPVRLEALQRLLEQANQSLGRLDGMASVLPNLPLFIYGYVRKEAVLSAGLNAGAHLYLG